MNRETLLKTLGIDVWQPRQVESAPAKKIEEIAVVTETVEATETVSSTEWSQLQQTVASCTRCELAKSRTQTVFGSGNRQADLMFVGEAPGADEDRQGEPFVGRAGMLLTEMIKSIGFSRDQVFIANILKCRPPKNRDPLPQEVRCCTPYLQQQINLIQPKLIVALGRIAAHFLLDSDAPLGKLRGQLYHYGELNTPLLISYHPAYLLRSPGQKAKSYQDLHRVMQML